MMRTILIPEAIPNWQGVEKLHQLALLLDRYLEVALLQHVFIGLAGLRQLGIAEFRGLFVLLEATETTIRPRPVPYRDR